MQSTFLRLPRISIAFSLVLLLKYVYRLTIQPLAKFSGPSLAALIDLYVATFDIFGVGRPYVQNLPALHKKYGPVIRAWPNQLHS